MSQQKFNKRQIADRLKEATALAKKGNYEKASYLLHPIRSDKRAKRLLEQMKGRGNKVKATDFFSSTLLYMGLFAVVVIGVIIFALNGILGGFQERDAVYAEFPARELVGNQETFVDLVAFCRDNADSDCFDWSEDVFTNYQTEIRSCIVVNNDGFTIDDENRDAITACFTEMGIPTPY